jgi:hypothetical protein
MYQLLKLQIIKVIGKRGLGGGVASLFGGHPEQNYYSLRLMIHL